MTVPIGEREGRRGVSFGVWLGLCGGMVGLLCGIYAVFLAKQTTSAREPLSIRLDSAGPFLFVMTPKARSAYAEAIAVARQLHPEAREEVLESPDLLPMEAILANHAPRYVMVFLLPEELDLPWVWNWFLAASHIDDDPFLDTSTGFITGESPATVKAWMERIRDAVSGRIVLSGKLIDNLGPNPSIGEKEWQETPGSFFLPVVADRMGMVTISHGTRAFTTDRLSSMAGAGLIHYGGHGYPDRVVDSLNGPFVRRMPLDPCVFFNGACYTGVTGRWFDLTQNQIREDRVRPEYSFALGVLSNNVIAYLAALHADHRIPVYQEMEYLAWSGASLGDVMRQTHNGVVMANGGKTPTFEIEDLQNGAPVPDWSPADIMRKGTASRILFGDPALKVLDPLTPPPFSVEVVRKDEETLSVTAVVTNPHLRATYTDTYHADLSETNQFNDRAWIVLPLPEGWKEVSEVSVDRVESEGKAIRHRLIGFAVEEEGAVHQLHIQVDLPSTGYMTGPMRREGSKLCLTVHRN